MMFEVNMNEDDVSIKQKDISLVEEASAWHYAMYGAVFVCC